MNCKKLSADCRRKLRRRRKKPKRKRVSVKAVPVVKSATDTYLVPDPLVPFFTQVTPYRVLRGTNNFSRRFAALEVGRAVLGLGPRYPDQGHVLVRGDVRRAYHYLTTRGIVAPGHDAVIPKSLITRKFMGELDGWPVVSHFYVRAAVDRESSWTVWLVSQGQPGPEVELALEWIVGPLADHQPQAPWVIWSNPQPEIIETPGLISVFVEPVDE